MKFNIEVEIDWMGEDGSIDDVVKKEISSNIVATVCQRIEKEMEEKATEAINGKVDFMCNNLISEFLNRKITVSDQWGEAIIVDTTIEEILKKKFENFWNEVVDKEGRSGNNGYGDRKSRTEWAIDGIARKEAEKFVKVVTEDTEKKIKATITEQLMAKVGAKIVGDLGLDKLLLEKK
jgi:hypothetical protein